MMRDTNMFGKFREEIRNARSTSELSDIMGRFFVDVAEELRRLDEHGWKYAADIFFEIASVCRDADKMWTVIEDWSFASAGSNTSIGNNLH